MIGERGCIPSRECGSGEWWSGFGTWFSSAGVSEWKDIMPFKLSRHISDIDAQKTRPACQFQGASLANKHCIIPAKSSSMQGSEFSPAAPEFAPCCISSDL